MQVRLLPKFPSYYLTPEDVRLFCIQIQNLKYNRPAMWTDVEYDIFDNTVIVTAVTGFFFAFAVFLLWIRDGGLLLNLRLTIFLAAVVAHSFVNIIPSFTKFEGATRRYCLNNSVPLYQRDGASMCTVAGFLELLSTGFLILSWTALCIDLFFHNVLHWSKSPLEYYHADIALTLGVPAVAAVTASSFEQFGYSRELGLCLFHSGVPASVVENGYVIPAAVVILTGAFFYICTLSHFWYCALMGESVKIQPEDMFAQQNPHHHVRRTGKKIVPAPPQPEVSRGENKGEDGRMVVRPVIQNQVRYCIRSNAFTITYLIVSH
jgi:hypothetical protein